MSGTVRILISSGRLLSKGKYIRNMVAEIYSDGSVVMHDNGSTYDGNVGNLITVCSGMGARYVPDPVTLEKEVTPPHQEKPLVSAVKPVNEVDAAPSSEGAALAGTDVASTTPAPSSENDLPIVHRNADKTFDSPKVESAHTSDSAERYMKCVESSDRILFEMLKLRRAGKTLSHSWLRSMLINQHETGYTFKEQTVRKRGGTIEDLFEKFKRTPRDQLFTEDAKTPYTCQSELASEEASTTYRMKLLTGYTQ
jgi:hypothetical protein